MLIHDPATSGPTRADLLRLADRMPSSAQRYASPGHARVLPPGVEGGYGRAEDRATHDTFQRAGGWMSDGPGRAYDHYAGWALHLYPTLWARTAGAADLAAARRDRDVAELDAAVHVEWPDGVRTHSHIDLSASGFKPRAHPKKEKI